MRLLPLAVLAGLLTGSCNGSKSLPTSPSTPTPNAPTASREISIIGDAPGVGQIVRLSARLTTSTGASQDVSAIATWQTSDPLVLLVVPPGRVTAVGSGEADVIVTHDGVRGSRRLTIAAPSVDRIHFEFAPGVSEATKSGAMQGAQIAQEFFQATLGRNILGQTRVIYTTTPSPFALGQLVVTNAADKTVTFYPPGWSASGAGLTSIMVHELFHILQGEVNWPGMGGSSGMSDLPGVRWLAEGTAEYMAVKALTSRGIYSGSHFSNRERTLCGSTIPPLMNLEDLNTFYTTPNSYTLAMVGADILTKSNLHRLAVYWTSTATMEWKEAFVPAFGMTIQEFYAASEERRRRSCAVRETPIP